MSLIYKATSQIENDVYLIEILNILKNTTNSIRKINYNYLHGMQDNGLCNVIYLVENNNKIINVIIPMYSKFKTISWIDSFYDFVLNQINNLYEYSNISKEDLDMITFCSIYSIKEEKIKNITTIRLYDFINNSRDTKSEISILANSKYLPLDYIDNNFKFDIYDFKCIAETNKILSLNDKELREYAFNYTVNNINNLYDKNSTRDKITKFNNTYNGKLSEYLALKYISELDKNIFVMLNIPDDYEDSGIDIIFIDDNSNRIAIDVKSTVNDFIKIKSKRYNTDYYFFVKNEKCLGFYSKFDYFSDIDNIQIKNDMYIRNFNQLPNGYTNYKDLYYIKEKNNTNY